MATQHVSSRWFIIISAPAVFFKIEKDTLFVFVFLLHRQVTPMKTDDIIYPQQYYQFMYINIIDIGSIVYPYRTLPFYQST